MDRYPRDQDHMIFHHVMIPFNEENHMISTKNVITTDKTPYILNLQRRMVICLMDKVKDISPKIRSSFSDFGNPNFGEGLSSVHLKLSRSGNNPFSRFFFQTELNTSYQ